MSDSGKSRPKSFYGAVRRALSDCNESGDGSSKKRRRTEDLGMSSALQVASAIAGGDVQDSSDVDSIIFSDEEADESSSNFPSSGHVQGNKTGEVAANDTSSSSVGDMYHFPGHSTPLNGSSDSLSFSPCSYRPSISDMIQQQNTLIIQLIKKHDTLSNTVSAIREGLDETKLELSQLRSEKENSPPDRRHGKKSYPNSLTAILSKIHEKSEHQFDPALSSTDPVNADVKHMLILEVCKGCPGKYSEKQVSLAVQRMYENLRRQHLNQRPDRAQIAQDQDRKKKFRSRRERLFARRSKYVPEKYRKKWDALNIHYMSEEEDGPDGVIIVRKLSWRSDKLNRLIESIDSKADKAVNSSSMFTPERKRRAVADIPSTLQPPRDAPRWAVKTLTTDSEGADDSQISQ